MFYQQAEAYLHRFTNYEAAPATTYGAENFDLRRMESLLELLGNPHLGRVTVHIAGTKGKGSIAAMTAAVLQVSGYRTGLFTSPHLCTFRERFRVDGQPHQRGGLCCAGGRAARGRRNLSSSATVRTPHHIRVDHCAGLPPLSPEWRDPRRCLKPAWADAWTHTNVVPNPISASSRPLATTTPRSWAIRWKPSPARKRALSSPVCRWSWRSNRKKPELSLPAAATSRTRPYWTSLARHSGHE